ncbi:hypothetical protein L0666_00165 [Octadecabacter sp. CECT 8868]|uniref:tetratricopeptide repeat protein n=1 Tax=Octadecabacter algicola TaxID=2909342 RepID=UPI001F2108E6|nr:tetratricopeptide repeat protein [Octadecabacter algicola]MCF2903387.1 hypothetical protein [Octadecabacter algicola]
MVDTTRNNKPTAADLLEAVSEAQQVLNFDGALQQVVSALEQYPGNLPLQLRKAVVLRQLRRNDEGIAHLQTLLNRRPRNVAIMFGLVAAHREAGEYETSLELIETILALQAGHRGALLAKIEIAIALHKFDDALCHANAAEAALPNDLTIQIKKAISFRGLRRHEEGISLLVALLKRNPRDITIMHTLATSHRVAGDQVASLKLINKMLAEQPNHRGALVAKIGLASRLQDFDTLTDFASNHLPVLMSKSDEADINLGAILGATILAGLPPRLSEDLFDEISDWLVAHQENIPSGLLWDVYERADLSGKDVLADSFLGDLFSRKTLGLHESKQILAKAFQHQLSNWKEIGQVLLSKQSPESRPQFELEYDALTIGASRALSQRERDGGTPRTVAECLLISRLLKQAGKQRVAVRYLHKVFDHHLDSVPVFRDYVMTSIASGEPHRVAKAKERLQSSAPQSQLVIALCFVEMNDLKEARRVLEAITDPQLKLDSRAIYIDVLIGLNEIDAAEQAIQEMRSSQSQKDYIHFNPSLQGLLFADAKLASEAGLDQASFTTIAPAVQVISDWMKRTASKTGESQQIPRNIVQYWDAETPPEDVSEIMQTWKDAPHCDYRLFSRDMALRFINDRLGPSWGKAFLLSRSPTEQSDFFRLCFLMLEGGIYADSDDRLICHVDSLFAQSDGLTVTLEPFGKIGNNIVMAPAKHPAIVWAAVSAKRSLLQRDNDSTWSKAGPGLLTRAVARYIQKCDLEKAHVDLTIIERYKIGKFVQYHTPLPYKESKLYWNSQHVAGSLRGLSSKFSGAPVTSDTSRQL